jgi:hypothetical protein
MKENRIFDRILESILLLLLPILILINRKRIAELFGILFLLNEIYFYSLIDYRKKGGNKI